MPGSGLEQTHQRSKRPRSEIAMIMKRTTSGTQFIKTLDRLLDQGIVIDAEYHYCLLGIDVFDADVMSRRPSVDRHLSEIYVADRSRPPGSSPCIRDRTSTCRFDHAENTSASVAARSDRS